MWINTAGQLDFSKPVHRTTRNIRNPAGENIHASIR